MDGKKYRASELIFHLRLNLFKEHFGLENEEFIDPLDDNMWEMLKDISKVLLNFYFVELRLNFCDQILKNSEKH